MATRSGNAPTQRLGPTPTRGGRSDRDAEAAHGRRDAAGRAVDEAAGDEPREGGAHVVVRATGGAAEGVRLGNVPAADQTNEGAEDGEVVAHVLCISSVISTEQI